MALTTWSYSCTHCHGIHEMRLPSGQEPRRVQYLPCPKKRKGNVRTEIYVRFPITGEGRYSALRQEGA